MIEQDADGLIVVQCVDDIGDILTHIHFGIPRSREKLGRAVYEVRRENLCDFPLRIRLVHVFKSVTEQTEGREDEDAVRTFLL